MKLIPLDSTSIYPINPVIYRPLITLWPAKRKTLAFTFAFISFPSHVVQSILFHIPWIHHFIGLTYSYVSNKNVSPQWLSLYTKTWIRGLVAFNDVPKTILSDRGTQFVARFWAQVRESLGTKLIHSSSRHPQTDGQTERVNQIVEDMLRVCVIHFDKTWEQCLALAEFAYNNSY
jgi:hypothetical protein